MEVVHRVMQRAGYGKHCTGSPIDTVYQDAVSSILDTVASIFIWDPNRSDNYHDKELL